MRIATCHRQAAQALHYSCSTLAVAIPAGPRLSLPCQCSSCCVLQSRSHSRESSPHADLPACRWLCELLLLLFLSSQPAGCFAPWAIFRLAGASSYEDSKAWSCPSLHHPYSAPAISSAALLSQASRPPCQLRYSS